MIKQLAWNTFKNTGSIDTYLELVKMKSIENNINNDVQNINNNGYNKLQDTENNINKL